MVHLIKQNDKIERERERESLSQEEKTCQLEKYHLIGGHELLNLIKIVDMIRDR